jgi:hypothetical protein
MKTWRTWEDFVKHAQSVYGGGVLSYEEIERFIRQKLRQKGLSPIAVLCYINWCDNGYLTQWAIAKCLNIKQTTVADHIVRLRKVWPFLPSHPYANGQRKSRQRANEFRQMTRLKQKVLSAAKVRATW